MTPALPSGRLVWVLYFGLAGLILVALGAVAGTQIMDLYERHFNPRPLLSYDYSGGSGMPTDKAVYVPGEVVQLIIDRCIRESGTLRNEIYLSTDGTPRGANIATIDSTVLAGCSSRLAAVAAIPKGTPEGGYVLAGAATITTRHGSATVFWRSVRFYVNVPE